MRAGPSEPSREPPAGMPDREPLDQRFARAIEVAAAYRARRTQGQAESLEVLLVGHADLRDLLEPMLAEASEGTPVPPRPMDRFAHFDLLEVLGAGGMGEVWLARDRRLERTVALKRIQAAALWSPEAKQRFRREARVVARLDHPHICKLYEADEHEGRPYLALQHIEGETLAARITRWRAEAPGRGDRSSLGPRTRQRIAETVGMLEQVAHAVDHAHERGVVHRDLKPGNIMLAKGDAPVVLDFGLARDERSTDESQSSASRPIGTPLYMAPEQIELGSRDRQLADRQTDVYALGVILYECLTLERPFEGRTERELQDRILASRPVPVERRSRAVPRDLAVVVAKAMEREPARRYRTARLLAEDLARVRTRQPVLARRVGVAGRVERWARRHPLVALLLLTLTMGLLVSLWQFRRAEANLERFLQMKDLPIVQGLVREADEDLWPAHPDRLARLDLWLQRARALVARLDGHRKALAELRQRALPPSDGLLVEQAELAALGKTLDDKRARLAEALGSNRHSAKAWIAPLRAQVAELEQRLAERQAAFDRRRWQFTAVEDRFLHDKLFALVRAILALAEPGRGRMASIAERQRAAVTLAERSLGDGQGSEAARRLAAGWREAARRVAADPRFAGFELVPQIGLVPLGPDPVSKLEEFAHLLSGQPAVRDEQGRLEIGEETGIVLVLIPGGSFRIGAQKRDQSQPNYDRWAEAHEEPVVEVPLEPYLLAKHEITQGQWLRVAGENPSAAQPCPTCGVLLSNPVENVSWSACAEMLRRLGLVLPTEAQWERAARAGTDTPWWTGREESSLAGAANVSDLDDGYASSAPVGRFRANPYGLWDVIGNVAEWCGDDFIQSYSWPPFQAGDGRRVAARARGYAIRGGSMGAMAQDSRSALRHWYMPDVAYSDVGCRPARVFTRAKHVTPEITRLSAPVLGRSTTIEATAAANSVLLMLAAAGSHQGLEVPGIRGTLRLDPASLLPLYGALVPGSGVHVQPLSIPGSQVLAGVSLAIQPLQCEPPSSWSFGAAAVDFSLSNGIGTILLAEGWNATREHGDFDIAGVEDATAGAPVSVGLGKVAPQPITHFGMEGWLPLAVPSAAGSMQRADQHVDSGRAVVRDSREPATQHVELPNGFDLYVCRSHANQKQLFLLSIERKTSLATELSGSRVVDQGQHPHAACDYHSGFAFTPDGEIAAALVHDSTNAATPNVGPPDRVFLIHTDPAKTWSNGKSVIDVSPAAGPDQLHTSYDYTLRIANGWGFVEGVEPSGTAGGSALWGGKLDGTRWARLTVPPTGTGRSFCHSYRSWRQTPDGSAGLFLIGGDPASRTTHMDCIAITGIRPTATPVVTNITQFGAPTELQIPGSSGNGGSLSRPVPGVALRAAISPDGRHAALVVGANDAPGTGIAIVRTDGSDAGSVTTFTQADFDPQVDTFTELHWLGDTTLLFAAGSAPQVYDFYVRDIAGPPKTIALTKTTTGSKVPPFTQGGSAGNISHLGSLFSDNRRYFYFVRARRGHPVANIVGIDTRTLALIDITGSEFSGGRSPSMFLARGNVAAWHFRRHPTTNELLFVAPKADGTKTHYDDNIWCFDPETAGAAVQVTANGGQSVRFAEQQRIDDLTLDPLGAWLAWTQGKGIATADPEHLFVQAWTGGQPIQISKALQGATEQGIRRGSIHFTPPPTPGICWVQGTGSRSEPTVDAVALWSMLLPGQAPLRLSGRPVKTAKHIVILHGGR